MEKELQYTISPEELGICCQCFYERVLRKRVALRMAIGVLLVAVMSSAVLAWLASNFVYEPLPDGDAGTSALNGYGFWSWFGMFGSTILLIYFFWFYGKFRQIKPRIWHVAFTVYGGGRDFKVVNFSLDEVECFFWRDGKEEEKRRLALDDYVFAEQLGDGLSLKINRERNFFIPCKNEAGTNG